MRHMHPRCEDQDITAKRNEIAGAMIEMLEGAVFDGSADQTRGRS